jgi:hypothetical protein
MKTSTERILTTHVGSLPRPLELLEFLESRGTGRPFDQAKFEACLAREVREVVHKQVVAGIDSVCDGELGKISYTFSMSVTACQALPCSAAANSRDRRRPRRIVTCSTTPILCSD